MNKQLKNIAYYIKEVAQKGSKARPTYLDLETLETLIVINDY